MKTSNHIENIGDKRHLDNVRGGQGAKSEALKRAKGGKRHVRSLISGTAFDYKHESNPEMKEHHKSMLKHYQKQLDK